MPERFRRIVARRWLGFAVFFGLGALAALGQAPVEAPWLAMLAWIGVFALLPLCADWRGAAWRGWALGLGHFMVGLHWIVEPFLVDAPRHGWMAPFALFLLAAGLGLFWALACGVAAWGGAPVRRRVLLLVVALCGAEMLRGTVLTGFPWLTIGHIWIGTAQMQIASVVGAPGLTFLTLGAAAMPALFGAHRAVFGGLVGAACLGLAGLYGGMRVPPWPAPVTGMHVRVVQPNAAQDLKWHPEHVWGFYEKQINFTALDAPDGGPRPDVVIWPETSIPYAFDPGQPDHDAQIAHIAAAARGAQVVLGAQTYGADGRFANMMVRLDEQGRIGGTYTKHHLVPFGEYMPLADVFARFGIFGLAANLSGRFAPGPGPQVMDFGVAGKVLPLICYEVIFPGDLRQVAERADWIIQITNDAWFGERAGPYQHLAQARLRAVEQGLPLMRSANTGISGGFDPYGRALALLPLGTAGFADLELPEPLLETPYVRFGDNPMLLCLLCVAGCAVAFCPRRSD